MMMMMGQMQNICLTEKKKLSKRASKKILQRKSELKNLKPSGDFSCAALFAVPRQLNN
jgi:hypothetical protein